MYRIVCESYENYKNDFLPNNTINYQKLEHCIYLLEKNIYKYPNFKSFLRSLESRSMYGGIMVY